MRFALILPVIAGFKLLRKFGCELAFYPDHFGHQAVDIEYLLRKNATRTKRCILFLGSAAPNGFLLKKHREVARVVELGPRAQRYLLAAEKVSIRVLNRPLFFISGIEERALDTTTWNRIEPRIRFSESENRRGTEMLGRMGIEPGRYVCFHARDSAFGITGHADMYRARLLRNQTEDDAAGRSEDVAIKSEKGLLQRYRNSDFADYAAALSALADRGLKGVRLGAKVDGDLTEILPNLVDFAGRHRADLAAEDAEFADIYLMANCRFYVGTATGVTGVAYIFNRPIVFVNFFPWVWQQSPPIKGTIFQPKLLRRGDGTVLDFASMIELLNSNDWHDLHEDQFFALNDFSAIDNTPEEIADAVLEMCERLDGHSTPDMTDAMRQRALEALYVPRPVSFEPPGTMAKAFLRHHRDLLPPGSP